MSEPVHALSSPIEAPVPARHLPRRGVVDQPTVAVAIGAIVGGAIAGLIAGLPPMVTLAFTAGGAPWLTVLIDRLVLAPRAAVRFNLATTPATEATSRGRFDEAIELHAQLADRFVARPGLHALALYHVATTVLARGQTRDALTMLVALDAFKGTKRQPILALLVPRTIALIHAQLGDVAGARRWLADAKGRRVKGKAYDAHIEALALLREGHAAAAIAAFEREWPDLERVLPAAAMRGVRARKAFALELAGGREAEVERVVAAIQPARPDELVYLTTAWPELEAFLVRRGLYATS